MKSPKSDPDETLVDKDNWNIMGYRKGVELRNHVLFTETLSMSPDDKSFLLYFEEISGISFEEF